MEERMQLEHVPISYIFPNPLNPRQDYSVRSEEMQKIIKERGWETGLTCYMKSPDHYVILSGHRRWYAATQIGEQTIPVFVVSKPRSELEELERLGSSQSGKIDWSPYEWARYTFDLWVLRNRCTFRELAYKMGVSETIISARIQVFRYYPHHEIEEGLEDGSLSITMLHDISSWIEKLKELHKGVVDELSEDMVRGSMIRKAQKKRFSAQEVRTTRFLEMAEKEHVLKFLRDPRMKLMEAYRLVGDEAMESTQSILVHTTTALERRQREVSHIDANSSADAKRLYHLLDELEDKVKARKKEVEKFYAR